MITIITGPQGSGKTTLATLIAEQVSAKEFRGQSYPIEKQLSRDTNVIDGVPTFEDVEKCLEMDLTCRHAIIVTQVSVNRFDTRRWSDDYRTQVNLLKTTI